MIPINVQGGFQANALGNGQDQRVITSGNWSAVYATGMCAGTGQWTFGKVGLPQFFGQNSETVMGPVICRPGDNVLVTLSGATPSSQASVLYWGWQGDATDGSDLAQVVPSVETSQSLPVAQNVTINPQATLTALTSAGGQTYTVNTTAFFQLADALYLNVGPTGSQQTEGPLFVDGLTANTVHVESPVGFDAPAGSTLIKNAPVIISGSLPQNTVSSAEVNIDLSVSGIHHVIAGVANRVIHLQAMNYAISAAGACAGVWQDTVPNMLFPDTFQNNSPRTINWVNFPLTGGSGVGLDFNVTATLSSFLIGNVIYFVQ